VSQPSQRARDVVRALQAARAQRPARSRTEPPFDRSWQGALVLVLAALAVLFAVQIVNAQDGYRLDRFGLRPRHVDGLVGIITQPFLHATWGHLLSNSLPFLGVGWVLMLSGLRVWAFVTGFVVLVGGLATWLVAPSGLIVGASALVFGWIGYLVARAWFSRRLRWIVSAVMVLLFFGTLLNGLLPDLDPRTSWQSHLCGFLAGVAVAWLLHPRRPRAAQSTRNASVS
jgi:membrane associated rhomboid family serine protease